MQMLPPISATSVLSFISVQDMGTSEEGGTVSPGAAAVARGIQREVLNGASFVAIGGDIAYADGKSVVWDQFLSLMEPTFRHVPVTVGVGNHEFGKLGFAGDLGDMPFWINDEDDMSGGECAVPLSLRFFTPSGGTPGAKPPFWYSYKVGSAHFIGKFVLAWDTQVFRVF